MKKAQLFGLVLAVACHACLCAAEGGGGVPGITGFINFEPPQPLGAVAVRVVVPEDKMVTGVRWMNGSTAGSFPQILAASGQDLAPPPISESVVMAEDVVGQQEGWSGAQFSTPIASETGTLFIVMVYPANYVPPAQGAALGVGYSLERATYPHFVTGDGEDWVRMGRSCRVLLEPILADRGPGVLALRVARGRAAPELVTTRQGLFVSPNPFNPQTKIELALSKATTGTVRVYDIRGRQVIELHSGALAQGANTFIWNGHDAQGRGVASGVYWVHAKTEDQSLTKKLLLLK